jgi:benzoate membrane transport protein
MNWLKTTYHDFSLASLSAGFVAILVGYASSVAIIFQAANAFNATPAQLSSWMWALGIGMGLCTLIPSVILKQPIICAWSTPGAAMLATASIQGVPFDMPHAVGAFIVSAVLIFLCGVTGVFEKLMHRIPVAIASALLAGVLARFGINAFGAAQTDLALVLVMLATYLACKRFLPRYAIPITLLLATLWVLAHGQLNTAALQFDLAVPEFVMPAFSLAAIVSLALPLFIVTMASQNLPGVAAIQAAGYPAPVSKMMSLTGLITLILAPFGAFALNLAAITAAICMSPSAHDDKAKRYTASISAAFFYILVGTFGTAVASLLIAFPKPLVACIAGLALLGTIGNALLVALQTEKHREAGLITFLVVMSGITLGGIGAAFWGVVTGVLVQWALDVKQKPAAL